MFENVSSVMFIMSVSHLKAKSFLSSTLIHFSYILRISSGFMYGLDKQYILAVLGLFSFYFNT